MKLVPLILYNSGYPDAWPRGNLSTQPLLFAYSYSATPLIAVNMRISLHFLALASLGLASPLIDITAKGSKLLTLITSASNQNHTEKYLLSETEVQACVYLATEPKDPYTVTWTTKHSTDTCMKRRGYGTSMQVNKQGITCTSLGDVEVDDDGACWWKQSRWGVSYNVDQKAYSGSTGSRWTTGPSNSDIQLNDYSPGTVVCGSPALCSGTFKEWSNDSNGPIYVSNLQ